MLTIVLTILQVSVQLSKACPGAVLTVFSDRDIASNRQAVQAALQGVGSASTALPMLRNTPIARRCRRVFRKPAL